MDIQPYTKSYLNGLTDKYIKGLEEQSGDKTPYINAIVSVINSLEDDVASKIALLNAAGKSPHFSEDDFKQLHKFILESQQGIRDFKVFIIQVLEPKTGSRSYIDTFNKALYK
jgi:hypothetical protein